MELTKEDVMRRTEMEPAVKEKIKRMLLEEVKTGELEWYYISVADEDEFKGGFYLQARGPTEAWLLFHRLGWHTEGCSTQTHGPIPDETINASVPLDKRWRRLSKGEL